MIQYLLIHTKSESIDIYFDFPDQSIYFWFQVSHYANASQQCRIFKIILNSLSHAIPDSFWGYSWRIALLLRDDMR
jgi:hypothetical protein